ncbi:sensor histidine kinase [Kiloniella laminariae]|uniref:sensor histidine kinase n=1 Tax=Kiloniella laminariae TaxID=454162 RepID=UPI0003815E08|nr:sensor histidine kinase [Kiloniella laminariae]
MISWWKNPYSVRGPLILIIGLILMAGFLITNILNYQVSKKTLRDALIQNELPLTSDNIYSEIQRDLLQPVFVASLMANDVFVQDWLTEGEQNVEKISQYLGEIQREYGLFTSFLVSEKTRNYYHFSGLSQSVSEQDPKDNWFFRVREMKEIYELNVDLNEEQGNTATIFINHKILNAKGEFLAAVGVGLELDTVAEIVGRYEEIYGRSVYFVDETGTISVRSRGAFVTEDNIYEAQGVSGLAKDIMSPNPGFFEYERDGEIMLLNSRYIPELGWHVIVEQQEAESLEAIRQGLLANSLVGVVVIAITMLIVFLTLSIFHSRLEQMLKEAKVAHQKMARQAAELSELAEQEAELNRRLSYEVDIRNRFFSIISHDLKSPFTALLGMTQMMSQKAGDLSREKLTSYAADAHEAGSRVYGLLNNLLAWSRLQMLESSPDPENVSLKELVKESIDIVRPQALEKNINLENQVEGTTVFADRNMVLTVLRNLLTNAVKFTHEGGRIEVSVDSSGNNMYEIIVCDNGVGMTPEQIGKVFSLDEKTSTRGTSGEPGTGLGLPLCKDILERNSGEIRVKSAVGEGACFYVRLPGERKGE